MHSDGRDLGWRVQLNQVNAGATTRQFADLGILPANFTIDISDGKSRYDGITFGLRRRLTGGLQLSGWYALQSAKSTAGNGSDELNTQNILNHLDPYADVQFGPSGRTDARHRFSISAIWEAPYGVQIAPIIRFRSALPVAMTQGLDLNANGVNNEIPDRAFAFDGFDDSGNPVLKDIGACETVNCGRGAKQSQVSLRVSRGFALFGRARVTAIAEIFNLFNAINPAAFTTRRFTGSVTNPIPNTSNGRPAFMRPQEYAGDFQNPEQRVGQIGFRLTF